MKTEVKNLRVSSCATIKVGNRHSFAINGNMAVVVASTPLLQRWDWPNTTKYLPNWFVNMRSLGTKKLYTNLIYTIWEHQAVLNQHVYPSLRSVCIYCEWFYQVFKPVPSCVFEISLRRFF